MTSTNFKKVRLFKLVREFNVSMETLKDHLERTGYADTLTGSGINAAIQDEAAYNELVSAFADNREAAECVHKKSERQIASEATPVPPAESAPEVAVATGNEAEPLPETILKIGIGHLFATGNRPGRDKIFHIAGMRYSEESAPEEKDWIINPGLRPTRRLYDQSKISEKILKDNKLSWEKAKLDIVPFFADLDVLFVYDRENQKEWFDTIVFKETPRDERPVLVDLLEMARFFLPGRNLPSDKDLIQQFVPETEWRTNAPRLPLLVRSLSGSLPAGGFLKNILDQIRSESQIHSGKHLVYSLFAEALTGKPPRGLGDFYALYKVAGIAHRIQWGIDLFAKPYGDTALRMIRDTDFPKDPDVEGDAHKRENWLIRQWTRLLSEEATQSLEPVSPQKKIDSENPPRVARPVVDPRRVDDSFNWLIEKANFKSRQEQKDFADFCIEAINRGGSYAIEAGTGTGKTLGYLIPACECIRQSRAVAAEAAKDSEDVEAGKIIIATNTKNLQEHLLEKEWRRLTQTGSLYQDFKAALLKGKNNFLCITAVADLFGEIFRPRNKQKILGNISPNDQARKRLAWLFLFLVLIRNRGETKGIPWKSLRQRFPDLNDLHNETTADVACTPDLCRMGVACIYPRHLQKAQGADVVVTNHHKLPWMDSQIQLLGHTCLIDEADQFPDNLRSAAAVRLDSYEIDRRFLWRIRGSDKPRGFARILQDRFTEQLKKIQSTKKLDEYTQKTLEEALNSALKDVRSILTSCEEIEYCSNAIRKALISSGKFRNNNYKSNEERWIVLESNSVENLNDNLSALAEHCKNIAECWDNLSNNKIYENVKNTQQEQEKNRIIKYRHYANDLTDKAREIKSDYPSNDYVHVCSYDYGKWTLEKIPYDISKIVKKTCFDPYTTTIFTSATLFVDDSLDLFSAELGMSFECDAQERIASPFKYKENVEDTENEKRYITKGFITNSIPPYDYNATSKKENHRRRKVAGAIARLAVGMNGRTLVLFTSTEEMNDIFEQVQLILEQHGIEPLLQDGMSLAEEHAFRVTEQSVLFGVDRFWTGVDFPGRTLSQVIIVRLPNPNGSDPIVQHRKEVMDNINKDDYWEKYYWPTTKLRLRQGFGRLIRKESDKGLFVVLDQRLWLKYARQNLQSELPIDLAPHSTEPYQMDWFIDEGLTHLGLKAEFEERDIDLRTITVPGETRPPAKTPSRKR